MRELAPDRFEPGPGAFEIDRLGADEQREPPLDRCGTAAGHADIDEADAVVPGLRGESAGEFGGHGGMEDHRGALAQRRKQSPVSRQAFQLLVGAHADAEHFRMLGSGDRIGLAPRAGLVKGGKHLGRIIAADDLEPRSRQPAGDRRSHAVQSDETCDHICSCHGGTLQSARYAEILAALS
jgi:hypothetical protein